MTDSMNDNNNKNNNNDINNFWRGGQIGSRRTVSICNSIIIMHDNNADISHWCLP